jgi:cobalt-zinc-cadmium resistance protein CzcA
MLDKIIYFSIRQKIWIAFFTLLWIGWGIYSVTRLPIDAVPDITNNQVQVITQSPNLGPLEIERYITYPLEIATANIPGLIETRSISRFGLSVVTIVFEDETDIYWARNQVSERIKQAQEQIPPGYGTPSLAPVSTGLGEIFQYTLQCDSGEQKNYSLMELRTIQDWMIKRELLRVKGVAEISSFGGYVRQVEVAINPDLLRSLNVSLSEVFTALEKGNSNTGAAYIEKEDKAYFIRGIGTATSMEDIENMVIKSNEGVPVLMKNVARIGNGHGARYGALTRDGMGETVGGIVLMIKGENSSAVIDRVKEKMAGLQQTLPKGVHIVPFLDREVLVKKAIHTVTQNLIEGGLIVIFVLVLMLGNLRAGLVVASVIPLSMLFAISMMVMFGVSGNLMSLGAIDFGIIVDGAVIIVEFVIATMASSKNNTLNENKEALVMSAVTRIRKSAIFGEVIILIVYLPILSLHGIEGKMFKPMAMAVIFALLGAFILSLTYVPMMSALLLTNISHHSNNFADRIVGWLKQKYQPVLLFALKHKNSTLLAALLLLVISAFTFNRLGGEFLPQLDEGDYAMETRMLPGTSLSQAIAIAGRVEQLLLTSFPDEIKSCVSKIGTSEIPTDPMPIETMDIIIKMKEKNEWKKAASRQEMEQKLTSVLESVPGVFFSLQQPIQMRFNELMTSAKTDVVIKIYGDDLHTLTSLADKIAEQASTTEGAEDVQVQKVEGLPQIEVKYHREQMAKYGISVAAINDALQTAMAGKKAGVYFDSEKPFDLYVRFQEPYRMDQHSISEIMIENPSGPSIPLKELASVELTDGPAEISRDNTHRRISIGFNTRNRDVQSIVDELKAKLDKSIQLPSGYSIHYGGQFENLESAKSRLSLIVPLSFAIIFFLLFLSFGSLRQCMLVFSGIPFSLVGGIFALWIRNMHFSISAGVGFIALFGVSVLNGIVLLAYYNQLRKENPEDSDEKHILEAVSNRFRPVIMTALVASLGFLPMAISHGAGAEVQKPLATVVIGGLVTSTLLTLIVLPVLVLYGFKMKKNVAFVLCLFPLLLSAQQPIALNSCIDSALAKHPSIASANAMVMQKRSAQKQSFSLPALDFLVQSPTGVDFRPALLQTLDFPTVYVKQLQSAKAQTFQSETHKNIIRKQLIKQVKDAYVSCVFSQNIYHETRRLDSVFGAIKSASNLRYETGDISKLDALSAQAGALYLNNQLLLAENNLLLTKNTLSSLTGIEETLLSLPDSIALQEIKQIPFSSPHPNIAYYVAGVDVAKREMSANKWRCLPGLSLGYFNQADPDLSQTYRLQFGLRVPVFFWNVTAKVAQSKYALRQAEAELELAQKNYTLEEKQAWSNYYAAQKSLSYFLNSGLPQANELERVLIKSLQGGAINITQYAYALERVYKIKTGYYEALKNYHQSLHHLQFIYE